MTLSPSGPVGDLGGLIGEFWRYPNAKTAADYRAEVRRLFLVTGRAHAGSRLGRS